MGRRMIFILIVLSMLLPCLAIAGGQAPREKPVTIYLWGLAGTMGDMYYQWKELYEADNPNVTVETTFHETTKYQDIITSSLVSRGEDIDIAFYWGGPAVDQWARDGLLLELTQYFAEYDWYGKKTTGSKVYETPRLGAFCFPYEWVSVPHYYYNKGIFSEAGVMPPGKIEDLLTISKKIKSTGYDTWTAGVVTRWPIGGIFNDVLVRLMTSEDFDKFVNWERDPERSAASAKIFTHPAAVEAWLFIARMISEDFFVKGANAMDDTAARQLFNQGRAAIYNSGSWGIDILKNEATDIDFDFFNLPAVEGRSSICTGYNTVVVPSYVDKQNIPVIMDFIDSTLEKKYAIVGYKLGTIPDNTTITGADIQGIADPMLIRIVNDVKTLGGAGIIDALQGVELRENYYDTIADIFDGKISAQEAAQRMYDAAVELLEKS